MAARWRSFLEFVSKRQNECGKLVLARLAECLTTLIVFHDDVLHFEKLQWQRLVEVARKCL